MSQPSHLKLTILAYLETFAVPKLQRVLRFVEQVDDEPGRKQRLLSFAGSWQQLDEDVFERFTTDLKQRRGIMDVSSPKI